MIKKTSFFLMLMTMMLLPGLMLFGDEAEVRQSGYIINISVNSWANAEYPISYSGDYSGEGMTPITIGPYDEPFTVTLDILPHSCANGICVVLSGWTMYVNTTTTYYNENVITVSTTPENPVINLTAYYIGSSPTPQPKVRFGPGDVNHDLDTNIVDALLVAHYYVSLVPPDNVDPTLADINCDTKINIVDALMIAQYYVGLLEYLCLL